MADKFYWHKNLNECNLLMKILPMYDCEFY